MLGSAYEGLDRAVDSQDKNLSKKIGAGNEAPDSIQTVYGVGYRLRGVVE